MKIFRALPVAALAPRVQAVLIAGIVAVVFWPGLDNSFVWDDYPNLVENLEFRGLGWHHLRWMATTTLLGHWIPVTWVTFGLDYLVWGMNPRGYHLTNLVIHVGAAIVFYFVTLRLLREATTGWPERKLELSAIAATLFFALHPLRVESVAWVTERRDVLSGFWFLLAVLTYLRSQDLGARRRPWLAFSVVSFALAVLAKSIAVTLPAVLVVLDLYPLRRLPWTPQEWLRRGAARAVWREKLPFVVVSSVGVGMAFYALRHADYQTPLQHLSLADRLILVMHSLWFYASTTAAPFHLSILHELPARIDPLETRFLVGIMSTGVAAAGLLLLRRRWPAGLALGIAYLVMLSPVSGAFHNGHQLVADRYSYLPCLGWAMLFGAGVEAAARVATTAGLRALVVATAVIVLTGQAALTMNHLDVWRDGDTLWRFALAVDPNCAVCHSALADELNRSNRLELAIAELRQALLLRPDAVVPHRNLGLALLRTGRLDEARDELGKALRINPRDGDIWANLGATLLQQSKPEDAVQTLTQGIRWAPRNAAVHANLGMALLACRRTADAVPHLVRALELEPKTPSALTSLISAYAKLGYIDRAREQYEALRTLDPELASRVSVSVATP